MKKIVSFLAVSAVVLFVTSASAQIFVANLAGGNERPTPFPDSSMGGLSVASVTVNDDGTSDALIITSAFGNDTPITAAHVHIGDADTPGPVICGFTPPAFQNPVIRNCHFDEEQTTALLNGNLYVNVHTMAHPGGEIRDQLCDAVAGCP